MLLHVFIIHVGSVVNKGTYALLKSEVSELQKLYPEIEISISCADPETLKRVEPTLRVFPPLVDIPFIRADAKARAKGYGRGSWKYKFDVLLQVFLMILQAFLSMISVILMKLNLRPIYRSDVLEQFKGADIIISTSDESFKEGSSNLPFNMIWMLTWWCMLFSRMWDIIVARRVSKKPIVIFPSSVGPFRTLVGRFISKIVFNSVNLILLRETHSLEFFSANIKTPVVVAADTALLFEPNQVEIHYQLVKPAIGVSPGFYYRSLTNCEQDKYISAHSEALDYLIEKYGFNVVFLPHNVTGFEYDDLMVSEMILEHMLRKDKSRIISVKTAEEFKHYLKEVEFLISSKMHPAVLASTSNIPTIAIVYDHKQTGFFEQIGLKDYIININKVSRDELLSKIELMLKKKEKIKEELTQIIPALQGQLRRKIRKTVEALLRFYEPTAAMTEGEICSK